MDSDKKPTRISIIPLPFAKGSFYIQTNKDGIITATPTKPGKMDKTPSHVYDPLIRKYIHLSKED